jgi:hypothetical protein
MRHSSIRTRLTPKPQPPLKLEITFCVRGVISPLLANLYLHWFDVVFHRSSGPAVWAKAKLVRYADDFVVLAPRYVGTQLTSFIEDKLETWLGLEINREKTRVVNLKEKGASLDFLGFSVLQKCTGKGVAWPN